MSRAGGPYRSVRAIALRRAGGFGRRDIYLVKSETEANMFHVKHDRLNFVGKSFSLVGVDPIRYARRQNFSLKGRTSNSIVHALGS